MRRRAGGGAGATWMHVVALGVQLLNKVGQWYSGLTFKTRLRDMQAPQIAWLLQSLGRWPST